MINIISTHLVYKKSNGTKNYVLEIEEQDIETLKELVEKNVNGVHNYKEIEGVPNLGRNHITMRHILMFGHVDTMEATDIKAVAPLTEEEQNTGVWVTDAVAADDRWIGDTHPVSGMPMMYQAFRTPTSVFNDVIKKTTSPYLLILKV